MLLATKEISKAFGSRELFEALTFAVDSADHIGLIGPNGAGKSTLLRLLAGADTPDSGEISRQKGLRVGYLEQTPRLPLEDTVGETVTGALAGQILSKLELSGMAHRPIGELSGGWRKRVALARELVKDPSLLLLDEPTNHLDIESILWLEAFLARAEFATLTVTHDRQFLQRVTNRILELDPRNPGGILSVSGDYAKYLERKELLLDVQQKQEAQLKNTLRRETEWLRQGAKARTTKQQARIQAHAVLSDQVEEISARNQTRSAKFEFQSLDKKPKRLLEAQAITKAYGDRLLFKNLEVFIGPRSRIGLLGTNGSGKSTLIRVLLGGEEPDSGRVYRSEHLRVAYFEQNRERLDPELTLRKTICPTGDQVNYRGTLVHINGYLDRFLFRREQIDMKIGKLSGGEQSRVTLALLMLEQANVLVLDEPTNDLDMETLNVLQDCLESFDGAVVLVTHDRYFLDQVADEILAFPDAIQTPGEVIAYAGYAQWENARTARWKAYKAEAKTTDAASSKTPGESKKRKLSYKETRELAEMESKIRAAEDRVTTLEAQSSSPENQSNAGRLTEIFSELAQAQAEVDRLYARWAELESQ
ncbi:ABC-F family ATP-binding cassette domain-containing protein [bacterium]|nr:ABC-F family ATP-binding cassette domain-containing protein [bacterium]